MILRDYQTEALETIESDLSKGCQNQLAVLATGLGKTVIFSHIPQINPGRTVVLAHREELLYQAGHKIQAANPTINIGIEQAEKHAHPDSDVILASVATIGREGSKRLGELARRGVTNLIIDEAHHSSARSYQLVINALGFDKESIKQDPCKLLLGVTATPKRSDNVGLENTFDKIVFNRDLRWGIEQGWLVDIVADRIKTETSLDGIKIHKGDYKEGELNAAVDNDERNIAIVRGYIDHALGKKAIIFCAGVEHTRHITDLFCREGVKAEMIVGDTVTPLRRSILQRFAENRTQVLVGCMVFTEGFDSPSTECLLMARPTKSQTVYIQQLGRGLRPDVDLSDCRNAEERRARIEQSKKPSLHLLDVVDNCTKHSPIMLPVLFGLPKNMKLRNTPVIRALNKLEGALREAPNLKVDKIKDITKIDQLKTEALRVNIFDSVELAKEVVKNSRFSWQKWSDGTFHISLDKYETLILRENTLGQWEGCIQTTAEFDGANWNKIEPKVEVVGTEPHIEGIFTRADRFIETYYPKNIPLVLQHARYHNDDATPKQFQTLKKFRFPVFQEGGKIYINDSGKKIPITKGLAGKLITKKINEFKQYDRNRARQTGT